MKKLISEAGSLLSLLVLCVAVFCSGKEAEAQSGGCCYLRKWYPEYGDCWPTTENCLQTIIVKPKVQ
ncbi:MAG TPA: hypothetical protein PLM56_10400 [Cyclobacteriaceae bacterium]|nr:hypothetical protein [Cyclobacteriaceae bacterium]HRF33901.1 hypothetical protein [Cyclobacteriaceae bacterium]